jgi:hypothetical protein
MIISYSNYIIYSRSIHESKILSPPPPIYKNNLKSETRIPVSEKIVTINFNICEVPHMFNCMFVILCGLIGLKLTQFYYLPIFPALTTRNSILLQKEGYGSLRGHSLNCEKCWVRLWIHSQLGQACHLRHHVQSCSGIHPAYLMDTPEVNLQSMQSTAHLHAAQG